MRFAIFSINILIELFTLVLWLILVAVLVAPLIRTLFIALSHIACFIL